MSPLRSMVQRPKRRVVARRRRSASVLAPGPPSVTVAKRRPVVLRRDHAAWPRRRVTRPLLDAQVVRGPSALAVRTADAVRPRFLHTPPHRRQPRLRDQRLSASKLPRPRQLGLNFVPRSGGWSLVATCLACRPLALGAPCSAGSQSEPPSDGTTAHPGRRPRRPSGPALSLSPSAGTSTSLVVPRRRWI